MGKLEKYHFSHLPVWINGNAYFNGAKAWSKEEHKLVNNTDKAVVELIEATDILFFRSFGPVLNKDIVVNTVIAMQNAHKARYFRAVRNMVRRIARLVYALYRHIEQAGIVGRMGCVFSIIEDNHIHHINNMQQLPTNVKEPSIRLWTQATPCVASRTAALRYFQAQSYSSQYDGYLVRLAGAGNPYYTEPSA